MAKTQNFILNESLQSARNEFNSLLKNPNTIILIKISLIIVGISWISYGLFYQFMPPMIPLLFSRPWGQTQLINKSYFISLPAIITMLFLINLRLASILLRRDMLMAIIILTSYSVCGLIGLITIIRLMILLA
ncbi:hypothetical protein COX08_03365 [Candidatus Beckwithbacteria bacterium CG23_combo_of_CG06-09_8_20_14_all_34_8]|uniref:Uncharacterized protein n=1 Tax=Candidatus Beckwithbacteria bacterium CG23_combo_of_CG06-09_8_20_14_all_34_8 TaxID=1974497 RepID=A0A2H0B5X7_9BACT|nr:MAG: hypothetical protein COX08_03365 [Candidatus Beckwithbacteria bacterium CG23_combo_of_CG06-09_8_20_14_all_34_8]